MKKLNLRQAAAMTALSFIALSASSCNRGYGCPSNFSMDDAMSAAITYLSTLLF